MRLALAALSISIAICAAIVLAFLLPQHTPRAAVTPAVALTPSEVSHGPGTLGANSRGASRLPRLLVDLQDGERGSEGRMGAIGGASAPDTTAEAQGRIGHAMMGGRASWVRPSLGSRYLAMRLPKGTLVRICGAGCVVRVVNDYGPSAKIRPRRIADLSAADFGRVCGPLSMGVCQVRVLLLDRVALPPTDAE